MRFDASEYPKFDYFLNSNILIIYVLTYMQNTTCFAPQHFISLRSYAAILSNMTYIQIKSYKTFVSPID